MRRRLNYANVTATLALFFAISGGALAAKHYLINSTKQINPKVLKALKGNVGPQGPQGTPGKEGTAGKEGAAGKEGKPGPVVLSGITEVRAEGSAPKGLIAKAEAKCPAGSHAISGGGEYEIEEGEKAPNFFRSEATSERKGWIVEAGNNADLEEMVARAVAYCAKEGVAVAP
jgi:hypothetical protein